MAYGGLKDLNRRTFADKLLRDKAFNIAKDPKYDGYQRGLALMVYKLIKKLLIKNQQKNYTNQLLENFIKEKVQSPYIDNIWGEDLVDMQIISKFNKGFRFLSCLIDIYSKCVWVIPLKDRKGITITNAFQKILNGLSCKPKKIWVDKGSEFYNRSMKSWLEIMKMYSTQ